MAIEPRAVTRLAQAMISEFGSAERAVHALAECYLRAEEIIDHYRNRCSHGFIYRKPRKALPMDLDSGPVLDVAVEAAPHG